MAARTPVTIESSPLDDAYHPPSITPDSLRRSLSTNSITRSSPQLLSPSTFVRPRVQPLKSGSRAQQVPAGAQAGFASAASIWKDQSKTENAWVGHGSGTEHLASPDHVRQRGESGPATKSAGKLTKPKKTPKSKNPSVTADTGPESPRFDSFVKLKEGPSKSHAKRSEHPQLNTAELPGKAIESRRPSVNLSEYSFNAESAPAQPPLPAKDVSATKKAVRKRASKTETANAPVTKKPRKCKAKSEAIILDSDEPDEAVVDARSAGITTTTVATEPVAKKPRSRKMKQPTASETNGEDTVATAATLNSSVKLPETSTNSSTEKSSYFDQEQLAIPPGCLPSSPPLVACEEVLDPEVLVGPNEPTTADLVAEETLVPTELAPRRRRSWTPAKDSFLKNTMNNIPAVGHELDENLEQVPFTKLLGNFSYLQSEPSPVQRGASGEASTKRRRIELSDRGVVPQPQAIDAPEAKTASNAKATPKAAKVAKKAKAVAKKPQTVTALALAAYQPAKEPDPVQSTVSTYFAPQKDVEKPPPEETGASHEELVAKAKKPRKSRAKAPQAEGDVSVAKKPAKPRAKTTKVKVKFDKNDYQAPLYSPAQACKQIRSQDFIFGTSSQLAADESPDFVRDMQFAIHQSEITCALPNSSQMGTQVELSAMDEGKSCAKVPTAPHGTCLSVEQAGRELWCVSARDGAGSQLAQEPSLPLPIMLPAADEKPIVRVIDIITLSSSGREEYGQQEAKPQKPRDPQVMTAPVNSDIPSQTLEDKTLTLHSSPAVVKLDLPAAAGTDDPPQEDEWMLLRSDDSVILSQAPTLEPQRQSHDLASSPARRTALQPLNANISMVAPDLTKKPVNKLYIQSFSTTAATTERDRLRMQPPIVQLDSSPATDQVRGRPRKSPSLERPAQTSPTRGRGRPRKNSVDEKAMKTSPVRGRGRPRKDPSMDRAGSVSPKRPVGRPRKETTSATLAAMSPKRPVGRPRKESSVTRVTSLSPRPVGRLLRASAVARRASQSPKRSVGRPRKDDEVTRRSSRSPVRPSQQPLGENFVVLGSSVSPTRPASPPGTVGVAGRVSPISPKRPVGRPRQIAATALSPRAFRQAQTPLHPSASQPTAGKEWTRIDEISDSDSPPTPSPRRRRASSSPAVVRPLDFDMPRSPSAMPKTAVPGNAAIKATDVGWPAIQSSIFPQIAETIKAAPLGNDMAAPSWHEKILLYDPIVLEDLTAWLNQQGLRYEIERLKHKTKTKGRKKKDAPPDVDEWEVVSNELKAWMVQKWCEDNSICCLWREGLRGGVKARY